MTNRKNGFTLIELLVVIAIIAILAAILFPVFAVAREKARQTQCASNEKQMGLGMMQYTQDYDECPPCGTNFSATGCSWTLNGYGWAGQIYPYIKSAQVFTCPDDKNAGQTNMYIWPTGSPNVYGGTEVTYAYNPMLLDGTNSCPPKMGTVGKLNSPSVTIFLMEVNTYRWGGGIDIQNGETVANGDNVFSPMCAGTDAVCNNVTTGSNNTIRLETGPIGCPGSNLTNWNNANGAATDFPTGRHSSGSNFVFWDGHVKWLKGTNVSVGTNAASSTTADPCNGGGAGGTAGTINGIPIVATTSII